MRSALLFLLSLAPSVALVSQPAHRAVLHAPRLIAPVELLFGGFGGTLPAEVREEIDPAVSTSDVMPLWQGTKTKVVIRNHGEGYQAASESGPRIAAVSA